MVPGAWDGCRVIVNLCCFISAEDDSVAHHQINKRERNDVCLIGVQMWNIWKHENMTEYTKTSAWQDVWPEAEVQVRRQHCWLYLGFKPYCTYALTWARLDNPSCVQREMPSVLTRSLSDQTEQLQLQNRQTHELYLLPGVTYQFSMSNHWIKITKRNSRKILYQSCVFVTQYCPKSKWAVPDFDGSAAVALTRIDQTDTRSASEWK